MENEPSPIITVLIAEDYEVNSVGLQLLFETQEDFQVVGAARDGEQCVRLAADLKPTVIVMDIRMPLLSGIDATRQIKECSPATKIIMLTSHSGQADVIASLEAGADGYCLKEVRSPQLVTAVRAVSGGACWLDPGIASLVKKTATNSLEKHKPSSLSEVEQAVLELLVEGLTNQQIGKRLFKGTDSVKVHVRHVLEKLDVSSRTQAAIKAVRDGLV
jgi:DNA-binding NarL/FixJ family response regulator